jgi:hypothetical protein
MQKIILPHAEIYWMDEQIIRVDMLHVEEMELAEMKSLFDSVAQLASGKPYCMLADLRRSTGSSSNEARQYAADHSFPANKIADALLVGSLAKKLMANFYIQFNKPSAPTRMFNTEEGAVKWLHSQFSSRTLEKA